MSDRYIPTPDGALINLGAVEEMTWDEESSALYVRYVSGKVSTYRYTQNPITRYSEWLAETDPHTPYGRVYGM